MLSVSDLPAVNAALNGGAGVLLVSGFLAIRGRHVAVHRACMIGALVVSAAFLASYLYYHYHAGTTRFSGEGWIRTLYFSILLSHTVLAIVIVPLVLITLYRALRSDFQRHRRIARWTLPLWLYVSITGIIVYLMLYQLYPAV